MSEIIIRTLPLDDCTIGQLELAGTGFKCFTLELPWLDNKVSISAIPAGTYKYVKRKSPSLGTVIHLLGTEPRTWIYIHAGNFTSQIEGCILVGQAIKDINRDGTPDVTNSAPTFNALMDRVDNEGAITIMRGDLK
tara:strand:+ start:54 stop:461 length:408 start_codon:yes stop_codon:yes gene_type:complete